MDKRSITYEILEDTEYVFDERGNSVLKMAMVSWNDRPAKLELRKWLMNSDGELTPNKGFSFLTEDGPSELVHGLLERGYGDNAKIKEIMERRGITLDIEVEDKPKMEDSDSFYDPNEILGVQ